MNGPGNSVLEAAKEARRRALLCAPFVKIGALTPVLEALDADLEIEVFTRWRPDEIAAGVSDTAVLPLVEEHGGKTYLCNSLHAKLFAFDDRALVGSANLTAKALGWAHNPNLELLLTVPATTAEVLVLEKELRGCAIPATAAIADEVERVAAMFRPQAVMPASATTSQAEVQWRPHLREPRELFVAYKGDVRRLTHDSRAAAELDLAQLEVPAGLESSVFAALIGTRLLQEPVIRRVDEFVLEPRRFGAVRDFLATMLDLEREEADYAWQTMMRWLKHFLPGRYEHSVPSHSEIFVRKNV